MTELTIGLGQMPVRGGCPNENLAQAVHYVELAAEAGCRVLLLPECLDLGWTHPSARELAQPLPGRHSDQLARAARQQRIYVVAGLVERSGDRCYNSAVLLSDDGELLCVHRKVNELSIAHDLYELGDRLGVVGTSLGSIGLAICADLFPTSLALGHSLARLGAQLILSPCSWAMPADHDNQREPYGALWLAAYSELARLYDLTVAGASNVGWIEAGPWAGRKCIGNSLAVGPGGSELARAPYGVEAAGLVAFTTVLRPPVARGADLAPALAARGYAGP
ncbi:MAG: carbon-nitrogen hydrolase family protein [Anaerolineae bacterium]|nr:carbon-nitrogen hydrolase family protein [Anaerolineae bacterium]